MTEEINNISKEKPSTTNLDFITRCMNCNLICSLQLNYQQGDPYINYECENGHQGNVLLKEYLNEYNKNSVLKEKCSDCGENQNENKGDFLYFSKCIKFLCHSCAFNHLRGNKHSIINFERYDSLCKIHSNNYDFYCIVCKKNLCIYCHSNHENHYLINLSKFSYLINNNNNIDKKLKNLEETIIII